jgi:hypothetical protein
MPTVSASLRGQCRAFVGLPRVSRTGRV